MLEFFRRRASSVTFAVTFYIEEEDDGTYHGFAPGLVGLHVDGPTIDEVGQHAIEATRVYLRSLIRHGDPLPIGPYFKVEQPATACVKTVEVKWPSLAMSGIS